MKKITVLFFFLLSICLVYGQEVTIGTGNIAQEYPLSNFYGYQRSAALYSAAEINQTGFVNKLAWDIGKVGDSRPVKIYLKLVAEDYLVAANWTTLTTGATLVYEGSFIPQNTSGYQTINLNRSFSYTDQTKNILVLVETNAGGAGIDEAEGLKIKATASTKTHLTTRVDNTNASGNLSFVSSRPNIKMIFGPEITCYGISATIDVVTASTVRFAITQPTPRTSFSYEIRTSGEAGSGVTGLAASGTVTDTTQLNVVVEGLTQLTAYALYVRANCEESQTSLYSSAILFRTPLAPVALPYVENFELRAGTTEGEFEDPVFLGYLNDNLNKWVVGDAIHNGGTRSLYISNDQGEHNAYTTQGVQVSKVYKDFIMPANTEDIVVSFDWRALGEGTATKVDYLTAWLVPTADTLTLGRAIQAGTDRIQLGKYNGSELFKQERLIVDARAFADQHMRLVFEWIQNDTLGTNPPAAIDNIVVKHYTCKDVTLNTIQVSEVTATGGKVSWETTNAAAYDVLVKEAPTAPGAVEPTAMHIQQGAGTSVVVTELNAGRQYLVWVRSNCGPDDIGAWIGPKILATNMSPVALPFTENFEGETNFEFKKNDTTNKWFIGGAIHHQGTKALYISDDFGTSHQYNVTGKQVSHVYKDFIVPTGSTGIRVSFDWLGLGERMDTLNKDYFRVWAVPATFSPTIGATIDAGLNRFLVENKEFNQGNTFNNVTLTVNTTAFAGQNVRLIFEWIQNESLGTQPPAAIDNLTVTSLACVAPTAITVNAEGTTGNKIKVNWPAVADVEDYDVYISTSNEVPSMEDPLRENEEETTEEESVFADIVTVTGTTYTFEDLDQLTTYYIWVRSHCDESSVSIWRGMVEVRTGLKPVALPYFEDFELVEVEGEEPEEGEEPVREDRVYFDFAQDTKNKWYVGSAVHDGGERSLYISKDLGVTHTYDNSGVQTSHAFKDFLIPTGATDIAVSFDWLCYGEGFGTLRYDFFTVWAVPVNYQPVRGTRITTTTDRIKLGQVAYNGVQNFRNELIISNLSVFAGQTMRLVFEWQQDSSLGTNPPAAIDNLVVKQYTCQNVNNTSVGVGTVTSTTGILSWTAIANTEATYDLYITKSILDRPQFNTEATVTTTGTTHTFTDLLPGTQYLVWVRSNCGDDQGFWIGPKILATDMTSQPLPYFESFEDEPNFEFKKNATVNKWFVGKLPIGAQTENKALFISENFGMSNTYQITTVQASHVYKDLLVPADAGMLQVRFDWRANGEGFGTSARRDYFNVWVVPNNYVPTGSITAGPGRRQVGRMGYNGSNNFTTEEITFLANTVAGTTMRLVFEWINDGSGGSQSAAAIDNLDVRVICGPPQNIEMIHITEDSATVGWRPMLGNDTYELYISTTNIPPVDGATGIIRTTQNPYTFEGLTPNTEYFIWIRTICSEEEKSVWVPESFFSGQIPGEMPYVDNFEGDNNWTLISNSINKWVVGTAVQNGGQRSLYVSNDNGASNTYSTNVETVTHAYRDIAVPLGAVQGDLKFDWRGRGESTFDFLTVWVVPTNYSPRRGVRVTSATNRVQIGGIYNQQATFTTAIQAVNLMPFAGQTVRILFEWRNDPSSGTQPPAAVDNVEFKLKDCPSVMSLGACSCKDYISFSWLKQTGITKWEVAFSTTNSATPDPGSIVTVEGEPEYYVDGLTVNTTYYFFVRNICSEEDGLKSDWVKIQARTSTVCTGEAEPFCAGEGGIIFPNVHRNSGVPQYPYQGGIACLGSAPYPVWYYLKIDQDGDLLFDIIQARGFDANGNALPLLPGQWSMDVDFVAFGPFDSLGEACEQVDLRRCPSGIGCENNTDPASRYPIGNIVDCSYSSREIESLSIYNAKRGEIYAVLITNFSGDQGFIKLAQKNIGAPNAGTTDCKFLCEVDLGEDQYLCPGVDSYELVAKMSTAGSLTDVKYTWFKDGREIITVEGNNKLTVTESGTYRVKVEKDLCNENPEDEIIVKFYEPIELQLPAKIELCDLENKGYEYFKLNALVQEAIGKHNESETLEYDFYSSLSDAQAQKNPLIIEEDLYKSEGEMIYVDVYRDKNSKCASIYGIRLIVKATAYYNAVFSYEAPICLNNVDELPITPSAEFTPGGTFEYLTLSVSTPIESEPVKPGKNSKPKENLILNKETGTINVAASLPGTYEVVYRRVVPGNMCGEDVEHKVTITIFERFAIATDGNCLEGKYHLRVLDLLGNIDLDAASYSWSGPSGYAKEGREVTITEKGDYTVFFMTKDGCYEELSVTIDDANCLITRGISPNGDGLNDYFDLINYKVKSFKVFNRNGSEVYSHGLGYTREWMGQDKSGNKLPSGTYFYVIETVEKTITGWVQLNY